jgi:predicted ATPase/DNA-binding SARP family transcriptional activator
VTLLGTFQVARGDAPVPVPGARLRGLIVRLALAGGRAVDPGALVDALWPEERPSDPANALQSLVSRLRKLLGVADTVVQVEGGYRLGVAPDDVDALRFERLAAAGRDRLRSGQAEAAASLLAEAAGLWGGSFAEATGLWGGSFGEVPGAGAPIGPISRATTTPGTADPAAIAAIAAVAPAVATRLVRAAAETVADLAEAELALGAPDAASARLFTLLADHPADERVAALLMDALAAQGRQAEALAVFERVREALADELGADPGAALRERHLRLLRGTPAAPAPETADKPPTNLPASLTSFIGRDDDLGRLDTLLAAGRLVTVLGPGGAGKTRLALEAARRHHHEYRDGTWLVDLASVTEPAKVGAAVLAAMGLRGAALFEGGRMVTEGGELDVLVDRLSGHESLLLVDNCEHLIEAVAQLISALLLRCAGLWVLATSREPLAIDGEALVPLGPLTLPEEDASVDEARRTAAVRLFAERASAVRPGFDVDSATLPEVLRVVRGLDGMPLALELAAARLRTLSLGELAAGLSDRFRLLTSGSRTAYPRHRTLRAVIAWSWDLLGGHERTVAERISVLPGGVTTASATAVCRGTPVPADEIPELLAALVDRSLLQLAPDTGRYRMLETLREYGIERLADRGEAETVRDLAARYLAKLISQNDPELRGPQQLTAMKVIRAEYDNALSALRYLCDSGDGDHAVDLALDLAWYWQIFGRHQDATYWLAEALALPAGRPSLKRDCAEIVLLLNRIGSQPVVIEKEVHDREAELRALTDRMLAREHELPGLPGALTAITLFFLRDLDRARAVIERLIAGSDTWLAGLAHMFRAQVAENEGDLAQVRADVTAALDSFGRVGDHWGLATALPMRALLRQYDGDLDGALADLRQARAEARQFGSLSLSDEVFIDLRWIDLHLRRGDFVEATKMIGSTRERALRSNSAEIIILVNALEAGLWVRLGELDRAEELLDAAEEGMANHFPFGGDHGEALVGSVRASLAILRGDPAAAEEPLARAYAAAVQSRDMPVLSMVAVTAAALADVLGRPRDAAHLLGLAARLRGTHDWTDLQVGELARRGRKALGEDGFASAYEIGWNLDGKTALTRADPALLRREALPAQGSASSPEM